MTKATAGPGGVWLCSLLLTAAGPVLVAAAERPASGPAASRPAASTDVLTARQWMELEQAVDQALAWLANQQAGDGSFPTHDPGQPAVTALCVLALLSRGHLPGEGPYAKVIDKAIDYTLSCQHPDGLIARHYPSMPHSNHNPSHTAHYNHAIAALCLSEAYGMTKGEASKRIRSAIEAALRLTFERRPTPKRTPRGKGGWRYVQYYGSACDSDLCMTSWYLMFLRSARNAGFDVPSKYIDEGLEFVRRCYNRQTGCFVYEPGERRVTRAMVAAGILSLSLGGQHQTEMARTSGQWLLGHPYTRYGFVECSSDAYLYGAFYASQAMFQLGGRYWADFYPGLVDTLVKNQAKDGSWPPDGPRGTQFGSTYSTAMAVLTLTVPDQLLPIFQR